MSDIIEPSEANKTVFNKSIADKILIELDGWQLITRKELKKDKRGKAFIDINDKKELKNIKTNHKVTLEEVEYFYNNAFEEALNDTNRYDINDFSEVLVKIFMNAVIKLAASNLWLKYNTSVTVNNDEGIIDYGQGGKLYKKYKKIIRNFVKSELVGLSSI